MGEKITKLSSDDENTTMNGGGGGFIQLHLNISLQNSHFLHI